MRHILFAMAVLFAGLTVSSGAGGRRPKPITEKVTFSSRGETEVQLEGVFSYPQGVASAPGVILCHPHPLYNGSMKDFIIVSLEQELLRHGFATLRFNFRGVGNSTGKFNQGVGEVRDVLGALAYLRTRREVDATRLYVVGYSFGARVGLAAVAEDETVQAYVGIGFPLSVENRTWDPAELIRRATAPLLFISGDRDQFSRPADLQALIPLAPQRVQVQVIEGASHFFLEPSPRAPQGQNVIYEVAQHTVQFLKSQAAGGSARRR